jgi:hypothetical protein
MPCLSALCGSLISELRMMKLPGVLTLTQVMVRDRTVFDHPCYYRIKRDYFCQLKHSESCTVPTMEVPFCIQLLCIVLPCASSLLLVVTSNPQPCLMVSSNPQFISNHLTVCGSATTCYLDIFRKVRRPLYFCMYVCMYALYVYTACIYCLYVCIH